MKTKRFNISLDQYLVQEVDKAAKAEDISRSEFIRYALKEHLWGKRIMLKIDVAAMTDEEVKEAFERLRRDHSRRKDHEWRRELRRDGH